MPNWDNNGLCNVLRGNRANQATLYGPMIARNRRNPFTRSSIPCSPSIFLVYTVFDASVSIVLKGIEKRPDGRDAIKSLAGVSFLWKKFVDVTDTDRGT